MSKLYNVSSSPHVRSKLTTGVVMYDVILCLLPATVMGIWHFKLQALLVIAASIISAVLAEFVFDYIAHRKNTLKDQCYCYRTSSGTVYSGKCSALHPVPGRCICNYRCKEHVWRTRT